MDRRTYKSKPQHLVADPRTGEIKTIVHPSDTNIGTSSIPANLTVFGTPTVVSQSAAYVSSSVVQAATLIDASGSMYLDNTAFGLRLTLSSSNGAPAVDIASGSTLFLTPYTSGRASVYNGRQWVGFTTAEISKVLTNLLTVDKNYDVFLFLNGNTPALELSNAWTNNTTRSQALTRLDGVLVKSADVTRRYVGTIRSVSNSHVADSISKRFVWNMYNRVLRLLNVKDTTSSWLGAAAAWRQTRGVATNCFEYVAGDAVMLEVFAQLMSEGSGGGAACSTGVGIDSTTSPATTSIYGKTTETAGVGSDGATTSYRGTPDAGYHKINWLEYGPNTVSFFGQPGDYAQSGMVGSLLG